jgi:hypothetical protein
MSPPGPAGSERSKPEVVSDAFAIPHTFAIDADGVLQDEHIGDTSIEGEPEKLLGRARELEAQKLSP